MPERRAPVTKPLATVGKILGTLIAVAGGIAIIYRDCRWYSCPPGDCVACSHPYAAAGVVMILVGIAVLVLSFRQAERFPCPTCQRPMIWIPLRRHWYCVNCHRYG